MPVKNQKPPGRPAELNYQENTVARGSRKDTASICHTLTAGKESAGREGGLGGRLKTEEKIKLEKKREADEGREDVKRSFNYVLLFNT